MKTDANRPFEQPEAREFLRCVDCGDEFLFPPGERDFYEAHGFSKPKRCPECRVFARQRQKRAPVR